MRALLPSALPLALSLVAAGCAGNAITELSLDLPAGSGDVRWAFVQARSGDRSFEADWAGSGDLGGLPLEASRRTVVVSIEADDEEELDRPLLVKVRYCRSARCDVAADADAQEVWITVERAFYVGHYTQIRLRDPLPEVCAAPCPPTVVAVAKCEVQGCRAGVTTRYCEDDGRHYCE